ncbi:sugar phosphate isomerase/epimerase family protein [Rhodococcus sp. NPDC059968]|uniref:sugar phosphate isomerase/epimerase family protein n=1 Tax=Rhodococcus sp. NPDC059968 TaxID=3347017 RepID=UPI00367227EC
MVSLGYESIQFSPKFDPNAPDLPRQIRAAKSAGFGWIAFDRHSLAAAARTPGGLTAVAECCAEIGLPCREIQSLRVVADAHTTLSACEILCRQVALLRPAVVPLIFFVDPTDQQLAIVRSAITMLMEAHPTVGFGIEFSPLFPVENLNASRSVAARLGLPGVGAVIDTWHVFNGTTTWKDLEEIPVEDIAMIQFNDHGPLNGTDIHIAKDHRLLPGEGSFPLHQFVDLMNNKGFDGMVGVEIVSEELRRVSPEEFARRSYDAAIAMWK